jgi:hypothetical protein
MHTDGHGFLVTEDSRLIWLTRRGQPLMDADGRQTEEDSPFASIRGSLLWTYCVRFSSVISTLRKVRCTESFREFESACQPGQARNLLRASMKSCSSLVR